LETDLDSKGNIVDSKPKMTNDWMNRVKFLQETLE
jgi:hypothetical protein